MPENLERLRSRGLSTKRSLALREFALGLEGLCFSLTGSRCTAFTSAPSECWPWKGSRLTRGCEPPHPVFAVLFTFAWPMLLRNSHRCCRFKGSID